MQGNMEALFYLMNEVFIHEQLMKEQDISLSSKSTPPSHTDAIRKFYDGIKGLESIFRILRFGGGKERILKRAYNFCSDWCSAPDNAKKKLEYPWKIVETAQILNLAVVTRVEQIANFLVAQC